MEFDQNKDSLFWIRSSDPNVPYKEFVFGEYNFMYIYDLLTEGQRRFFEMHRDSLAKVRGSLLPPLPELSENPGKIKQRICHLLIHERRNLKLPRK